MPTRQRRRLAELFGCLILMVAAVSAFAAPVPDTGQTKCYDVAGNVITCLPPMYSPGQAFYGQDANYSINPMSYTKLDGSGNALPDSAASWVMVKDNVTGLIWEMKTNKDGVTNYNDPHDADNTYTWYDSNPATNGGDPGTPGSGTDTEDFIKALNDANYGGFSDWRLPTIKELAYIVDYSIPYPGPTINTTYFPNTAASWYWSSTTYADDTSNAWVMNFLYGYDHDGNKYTGNYVRAVRGGQSGSFGDSVIGLFDSLGSEYAAGSYTDNGDGTVTDASTGLMWQQDGSTSKSWSEALAYCEALNLGGYTDWRLPNIKELRSLVDYSRYNPAINTTYFPNTAASWYWSSTSLAYYTSGAWVMHFDDGYGFGYYYKDHANYVRAVRGGQYWSLGNLVISPLSQMVTKDAGSTAFSVSNTGTGTMPWTASVISGSDWLSITSGSSGSNSGTITCGYAANTGTTSRTATIRVTATEATGSPMDVTVTQAAMPVQTVLSATPTYITVTKEAGATGFYVFNTGTGTMPWTAEVISGSDWLMIVSGGSGSNSGTTICSYTANTGTANRIATIRVTAAGATGSPVDVTVIQGAITTDCMATLDGNLSLHIPFLSYLIPYWGAPSYWADLVYEPNPAYPTWIPFKLTNAAIIQSGIFSCDASTLSDDLKVHIPDLLFPDGVTRMWVDMEYSSVLSTDSNAYFVVMNYGAASN